MLKRSIKYRDFNGVEREETFYFNLTKAELVKFEAGEEGGVSAKLDRIMKSPNPKEIIAFFDQFIMMAYGEKSDDGRRFVKSPEISKAFSETPAYDALFTELVLDAKKAADFVNALIPDLGDFDKAAKASIE